MWWRTAYSSLYRHPVHALHQYEVRAEHLAGCLHREALTVTGYALYAVAVGLTGSMYMVSITALSACGVWCRPLTAWHPLHISGSGVGTDLGSGPISNVSKHMRMYYQEVFGCWRRVGVWGGNPFWYHIGWWSGPGSWGPGGGPGVVPYFRCVASSCGSQACAICLACALSSGVWGLLLGFVPSRGASRGPLPRPFLPSGGLAGAPSLSWGPGWGPRAPLGQVPYRASP